MSTQTKLCLPKSAFMGVLIISMLVGIVLVYRYFSSYTLSVKSRAEGPYCYMGTSAPSAYPSLQQCRICTTTDLSKCNAGEACVVQTVIYTSTNNTPNMYVCEIKDSEPTITNTPTPKPTVILPSPITAPTSSVSFNTDAGVHCYIKGTIKYKTDSTDQPLPSTLRIGVRLREINPSTRELISSLKGETDVYDPVNNQSYHFFIDGLKRGKTYNVYGYIEDYGSNQGINIKNGSNIFQVFDCTGEKSYRYSNGEPIQNFPVCDLKPVCDTMSKIDNNVNFRLNPQDFK
ncbi:hypothetical protein A2334_03125 [Candidatus Roizmanbacteria bacterium RIFOXYB2_FULL_38_10]|uniref:Uncharacterized protein n=1 Tax=Candidatus Roizmanbacteria bacterium RIFOXYD1_FULL_38_12 TaxID=1802093 RepID=A0A1F7L146_9BACT|nr:MAG: hypothetical protein A3K47_03720 [Candidatus Roizmanbacteria bacterium RIFOXYA2_FULL_38_14]OGK63867.1 MAG: hypothetical protein A3K27_03720 [Candidatus Roizmanbacteria bacterium RIFOXYA1_FULL_37_12]OGK65713.1 MAG: hypothetical protein A3K38_03720 [Candidatus Roizmanbacteria bacterium RIFOXYB1_FULL_40_23]OGK67401.1 MAG: hypothetical protein A2334_03125 [Candidatus Roizmanbacteria bacterium RIFOXYB2_FULL_38_10]OGK70118.1 MAG: hypothetical protein A3K21_03725 [Candidatus Roizmanbacteria ba